MAYKQGYSDRKDESLGMKDGPASSKKQDYKDRRAESYGMQDYEKHKSSGHNMKYMDGKEYGVMGHDKMPDHIDVHSAQKKDLNRIDGKSMDYRGSPDQAFHYHY